jgi:hypothetical protein
MARTILGPSEEISRLGAGSAQLALAPMKRSVDVPFAWEACHLKLHAAKHSLEGGSQLIKMCERRDEDKENRIPPPTR